jgi:hypothetical protein
VARARPTRVSTARILADLRLAGRKGDRSALTLALEGMRLLAHSPRYWDKYLTLLRNPFARLVDLLVIKQGEKIAHQKVWRRSGASPPSEVSRRKGASPPSEPSPRKPGRGTGARAKRRAPRGSSSASQPALFD